MSHRQEWGMWKYNFSGQNAAKRDKNGLPTTPYV